MGQYENSNPRRDDKDQSAGLSRDYIRTYLGLMGSGKTTRALQDVAQHPRVVVYSPGMSNRAMLTYPYILDTPEYLKDFGTWIARYPRLRIEKRSFPTPLFRYFAQLKGTTFVLDDLGALTTSGQERNEFQAFVRTVRFNGNTIILTTHRARGDVPPLVRHIGTSFYWVGPGTRSSKEIETLFELANYPISLTEFRDRMERNHPFEIFPVRKSE